MTASALVDVTGDERSQQVIPDIQICQCRMKSRERDRLTMVSGLCTCEYGTHGGETITKPTSMVDEGEWTQVAASEVEVSMRTEFAESVD